MSDPQPNTAPASAAAPAPLDASDRTPHLHGVRHLEVKAAALVVLMFGLLVASVLYLLYARGAFEPTQRLVLTADDSEGVVVGMNLTFSGFAIGRVHSIELADEGNARILIDVPSKDARWLRSSSVFTMVRGLVGGTNIRAYSGVMTDPPLPADAVRAVIKGDATADIPRVLTQAKELLENLSALSAGDSALGKSMGQVAKLTERMNGPGGALGAVLGNEADVKKIMLSVERTNALLARLDGVALKADGLVGNVNATVSKADAKMLGPNGIAQDIQATVVQMNGLLADSRASLKRLDAVLAEAQGVGANVRGATQDMGQLRAEVEANLRKIDGMVNELNRKWPLARPAEIVLP